MSDTFLPQPIFTKLSEIEAKNLESAEAADKAYYHEHLSGDAAPKEALRVRTELGAVLQILVDNQRNCGNNNDHNNNNQREAFEQKLKSLESDFDFMIKRASRVLEKM